MEVVFDARSGDFWIVARPVYQALQQACNHEVPSNVLLNQLPASVIETLSAHAIIRSSHSC